MYHIVVYASQICNLMQRCSSALESNREYETGTGVADTDQDGVDFLVRDLLHPTTPILGGCFPVLLVDMCAGTRPVTTRPRRRLKFFEEFPK